MDEVWFSAKSMDLFLRRINNLGLKVRSIIKRFAYDTKALYGMISRLIVRKKAKVCRKL